jgi:hypothetical protein
LQALTAFVLNGVFSRCGHAFHEKLEATGAILLFLKQDGIWGH